MKSIIYKEDCFGCVYLNSNGTCANRHSIMFGVITNRDAYQSCGDRRYYSSEAYKRNKKRRVIQSIYDYE